MGHAVASVTKNHTKFYYSSRIDHLRDIVFKVRVTYRANDDAYMVLHGECLSLKLVNALFVHLSYLSNFQI